MVLVLVPVQWTAAVGMVIPGAHLTTDPLTVEVAAEDTRIEAMAAQEASLAVTVSR